MGIKVRGLLENQVYMLVLPENLVGVALQEFDTMVVNLLDQMPCKTHLVIDMRALKVIAPIHEARNLKHTRHPRLGRMLMIGLCSTPTARFVISAVAQLTGMSYKGFNTEAEALTYLHEMEGLLIPEENLIELQNSIPVLVPQYSCEA